MHILIAHADFGKAQGCKGSQETKQVNTWRYAERATLGPSHRRGDGAHLHGVAIGCIQLDGLLAG